MSILSPSLLSADFLNLEREILMINESEADWIHVDVMDGVFVPNISFGFPIIKAIKNITNKPLDVHLMIVDPTKYIEKFKSVGSDILTIHYESEKHIHRAIEQIKHFEMKAGVSLNPHTPVHLLEDIIHMLDLVLIMSVNPGFGGQSFIESTYQKVEKLKSLIAKSGSKALIEVDGGVNLENCQRLLQTGVDVLVAGNAIFNSDNPKKIISSIKSFM